jgi:HSP20 family molecular chaperone IbpA
MSRLPAQHHPRAIFPEFADLLAGFPSWASVRPAVDSHIIRLEDELKDGTYEVRAEIPGVDPAKDIDITVREGVLTIKAERTEEKESAGRSEFSYGSFARSIALPQGADEDAITASYDKGILTISMPVREPKPAEKRVQITSPN